MSGTRTQTPEVVTFYQQVLRALREVPFLLGGGFAFEHHTGVARDTRDLDVFVRPADMAPALARLEGVGCRTELVFPHWLAKGSRDGAIVDVIFGAGNGVAHVDDGWFVHAIQGRVLGQQVRLCPLEEMIWSKAFVMERERFDGADVLHMLRAGVRRLDWARLLARFGSNWRVLLAHLVLFGYVYPRHADDVPAQVIDDLLDRLRCDHAAVGGNLCRGTLLSREQYLVDIGEWGLADARLGPGSIMTEEDVALWTAGAALDGDRSRRR